MDSLGYPGWKLRPKLQQQRRITRSVTIELCENGSEERRTNIRMPSASAFQFSAIFLSSSIAISKYIEKIGPEPSTKSDSMSVSCFCAEWGGN